MVLYMYPHTKPQENKQQTKTSKKPTRNFPTQFILEVIVLPRAPKNPHNEYFIPDAQFNTLKFTNIIIQSVQSRNSL